MIRLLLRLLRIKDYEICLSCQTLKEQLNYEREEKKRLTDTLLNIINPKVIEAAPVEVKPFNQSAGLFSKRRAAKEEADRQEAKILKESKFIGRSDDVISKLENELGIS